MTRWERFWRALNRQTGIAIYGVILAHLSGFVSGPYYPEDGVVSAIFAVVLWPFVFGRSKSKKEETKK